MQFREMIFFPRILEIISIEIEKKKKYDKFKRRLNFDRKKKKENGNLVSLTKQGSNYKWDFSKRLLPSRAKQTHSNPVIGTEIDIYKRIYRQIAPSSTNRVKSRVVKLLVCVYTYIHIYRMVKNKRTNSQHLFQPDFSTKRKFNPRVRSSSPDKRERERENQAKIHPCDLTEI